MHATFPDEPPSGAERTRHNRHHEQLKALADIAAQGATLQPKADAAVADCGGAAPVHDSVALDLGRSSHAYSALYERARHLSLDADLLETRDELCRVLSYHLHMLRDAGDLAFSGRPDPRTEPFRLELAEGLGSYATKLLTLAGEYRARLLTVERGEPDERFPLGADLELDDVELSDES